MAKPATHFPATDILPDSSISGFQFDNGARNRVFYQGKDGALHALYTNDGDTANEWVGGDALIVVRPGLALPGTPLASAVFEDKNGVNARTYYLGFNYQIRVVGVTKGETIDEVVGPGYKAASYSTLGAIAWTENGQPQIRIYYQSPDDEIHEIASNGVSYGEGPIRPAPPALLKGTGLSFINRGLKNGTPSIRGYYQHTDYTLKEICWDKGRGWYPGTNFNDNTTVPDSANISASVTADQPPGQMNVYWQHQGNTIWEAVWSSGWHSPSAVPNLKTAPNGKFVAISYIPKGGSNTNVRIIFLGPHGLWTDRRYLNGQWVAATDAALGTSGGKYRLPQDF